MARRAGARAVADAFAANAIDGDVLRKLTGEDLKELGVVALGHRKKLLEAIAALPEESAPAYSPLGREARTASVGVAERRQLTVLFCDLVGSTELSARLDPEDLRAIMGAYQAACAEVIGRFDGHVAKFLGDGVLVYFGWPRAHEDDAERAVRAGLGLLEAVAGLEAHPDARLQARVGIATGQVVVGDLISQGAADLDSVTGDAPNVAARLQALAPRGTVVIAEATRRLIGGLFELDDLGPQRLKGFDEPLAVWRVTAESRAEGRFEAHQTTRLSPLVGRDEELSLLLRHWRQAVDGDGQVVLLTGEPGIGKSRLVREVGERLEGEPHLRLLYQCSPHHTTSPLHPVIEQLKRAAGFERDDSQRDRLEKLEALLAQGTQKLDRAVPLVAALLSIPANDRYPLPELTPQRQKELTLEALVDQLGGLSAAQPVIVTYEDTHWIDPSTLELLGLAIDRIHRLRVLLVITFRPEFAAPWTDQPHLSALPLTRLGRREGAAIVDRLTCEKRLPVEVRAQILSRTDGVPLFVEELTKTVLEAGLLRDAGDRYELAGPLPPLAIPSSLHDSLMARLDRLSPVKEVAQIGAVIGREFSHELIAAVSPLPERNLDDALDRLVAAELVFRRGTPPDRRYIFKHALVQDAAYQSLLKSRRQQLHARIAQMLAQHFPDTAPELLAYHLTEAQQYEEAVPKWLAAGQAATARSAYAEAAANLRRGLDVVGRLADPTRRVHEEIRLQNALGFALIARGPAPDVAEAYERARSLCKQVDLPRELFTALFGLWFFNNMRLDLEATAKFSNELLAMVEEESDSDLVLEAHHAAWSTGWPRGELEKSLAHTAAGINLYRREAHHPLANVYAGHDPGVCCRYSHGLVSWLLGFPDRAAERVEEALALARELKHPLTRAVALAFASFVRQFRREPKSVREFGRQTFTHCTEHGFRFYAPQGVVLEGWALAAEGQIHDGIEQVREGLASLRAMGAYARRSYFLGLLAEVSLCAGECEKGLEAISEGLALVRTNGERWWQAEPHRLQGELLLAHTANGQTQACSCFERALDISRQQKARSLELRAATSLARLRAKQSKRAEARDLLAPVYGWFTEGYDTADLKDAKALLDELA